MSTAANSTTVRAWDAELVALRDEIFADGGVTLRQAAEMALGQIGALREYADQWDARADDELLARYWPHCETGEDLTPPPAPAAPALESPAARKAAWHLAQGVRLVWLGSAVLVPSGTRSGTVHRVENDTCSCEAFAHGRDCWHRAAVRQSARTVRQAA